MFSLKFKFQNPPRITALGFGDNEDLENVGYSKESNTGKSKNRTSESNTRRIQSPN